MNATTENYFLTLLLDSRSNRWWCGLLHLIASDRLVPGCQSVFNFAYALFHCWSIVGDGSRHFHTVHMFRNDTMVYLKEDKKF